MKRFSILLLCTVACGTLAWSAALACDTCGCQKGAAAAAPASACADCPGKGDCASCPNKGHCAEGKKQGAGCAECAASGGTCAHSSMAKSKEGPGAPFAVTACPECQAAGAMCAHCQAAASDMLINMAGMVCPDCEAPEICDNCKMGVEVAMELLPALEASRVSAPAHSAAYMEGKFFGDMGQLVMQTIEVAGQQGLVGANMMVASLYPTVMSEPIGPDTPAWACVSVAEGASVAAPLQLVEVPAGEYMMVNHHGSYEMLGASWMAALCFAEMHGIALGDGIAGEHYMNNPMETPEAELLTQIFIPLAPAAPEPHGTSA